MAEFGGNLGGLGEAVNRSHVYSKPKANLGIVDFLLDPIRRLDQDKALAVGVGLASAATSVAIASSKIFLPARLAGAVAAGGCALLMASEVGHANRSTKSEIEDDRGTNRRDSRALVILTSNLA